MQMQQTPKWMTKLAEKDGFPEEMFFGPPPPPEFKCRLCENYVRRAMFVEDCECGNLFCHDCLATHSEKQCPDCGEDYEVDDAVEQLYIDHCIWKHTVRCKLDCGEVFELGKEEMGLDAHQLVCSLEPVACPECQKRVARGKLDRHTKRCRVEREDGEEDAHDGPQSELLKAPQGLHSRMKRKHHIRVLSLSNTKRDSNTVEEASSEPEED